MTSVGFSWLPSMAVMWGFYPTIENYPLLLKKNMEGHCTFLSQSWAPNWESIITALFSGCPYLHALLRKCQSNDKPFYFLQCKIFPTYFHLIFSLVWKRLGAPDWLLIFFNAFSTYEHNLHPLPQQIFCMAKALVILMLTPRSWDGTALSELNVAIEVLCYGLSLGVGL